MHHKSRKMASFFSFEQTLQKQLNTTKFQGLGHASGNCINEGQSYETDFGKVFVKWNPKPMARKMFDGEFTSLKAIRETGSLRVPEPIKVIDHPDGSGAVFVMEHLDMRSLNKFQAQLGTQLGRLHLDNIVKLQKVVQERSKIGNRNPDAVDKFGFCDPTSCGYIPQINDWQEDWMDFYTRQRLQPQLDMIEREYRDQEARSLWSRLQLKITDFFKGISIQPSLLHGDLWSGNVAETDTGPVAFDPASFYGHHEFDLAIGGMFGGFSRDFYHAYHKEIPKHKGFNKRHQLYLLFNHLNHWNHFGSSYRSSSLAIMRTLLEQT